MLRILRVSFLFCIICLLCVSFSVKRCSTEDSDEFEELLRNEFNNIKTKIKLPLSKPKLTSKTHFDEVNLLDEQNFRNFLERTIIKEEIVHETQTPVYSESEELFIKAETLINTTDSSNDELGKQIIEYLEESADLNNTKALNTLANSYIYGDYGLNVNFSKACELSQRSAEMGDPIGQRSYAFHLDSGLGVVKNTPLALIYYTLAAKNKDPEASFILSTKYTFSIDVTASCSEAIEYLKHTVDKALAYLAETKFDYSTYAHTYLLDETIDTEGDTTPSKEQDLVEFYHFSADNLEPQSITELGFMYLLGIYGVKADYQTAKEYFELSASLEDGKAFAYLGYIYENGLGVDVNIDQAITFYETSVKLNSSVGMNYLGEIYLKGKHSIPKNYTYAYKLFKNATTSPIAYYNLGKMHYYGLGVAQSIPIALSYFKTAAVNDVAEAQFYLGKIFHYGGSVQSDCNTALDYYWKAASKGPWLYQLDRAYNYFKDGKYLQSLFLYHKLASFGIETAMANVAWLYSSSILDQYLSDHPDIIVSDRYSSSFQFLLHAAPKFPKLHVPLGDLFYYGKSGMPLNKDVALSFYRSSPTDQSYFNLGYMYHFGDGVDRDLKLANYYYKLALREEPDALLVVVISMIRLLCDMFIRSNSYFSYLYSLPELFDQLLSI